MADFLQTLIIAITLGSLYALIALGYTMVYGVLKLINFAHSDVVVLGAWISVTLAVFLLPRMGVTGATWWAGGLVLILAMVICGTIGFLVERLAYKPIRKAPRLNALITAIGVSLFLQNFGQLQYTIISNEKVVASGDMQERGQDPKTVRLTTPITFEPNSTYAVRVFKKVLQASGAQATPATRRIAAPAGTYEAGKDIAIESAIGRSDTREARFEIVRIAAGAPLKLPFGAMPTAMPQLVNDKTLAHAIYVEFVKRTTIKPAATSDSAVRDAPAERVETHAQLVTAGLGARPETLPEVAPPSGWESSNQTLSNGATEQTVVSSFLKPVQVTLLDVMIVATAAVLLVGLQILVFNTRIGTAMRAVSYNMETSALMGIPVDRIVSLTFIIGTALAAAAGFLFAVKYTQIQQPAHATWVLLGLKAFVAAVVGGIGNIRGATLGGFLIAFIEQFGAYAGQQIGWDNASAYTDVFVFVLLIVVLLVKPTGIFGSTVREKV